MKLHETLFASFTLLSSFAVHADYVRTGPMNATVCSGIGIKSCSQVTVRAVEQGGGMYEPTNRFDSVDSYSGSSCTIRTDGIIRSAKAPSFYKEEGGEFVKISPDYVTFKCTKR